MSEQKILLIRKGAQVTAIDILDNDADLKVTDDEGDTLLHIACKNHRFKESKVIPFLRILLDRGLDINVKNKLGKTILHLAIDRRNRCLIDFCIEQNADLNVTDFDGNTLSHYIIEESCRKVHSVTSDFLQGEEDDSSRFVEWMMSKGIDFFYTRNAFNYSALYLANALNVQHILLTLLERIENFTNVEKDQIPLLCAFLKSKHDPDFHCSTLKPFNSAYYSHRHTYNIVKIILEKNKSISDEILKIALYSAIRVTGSFDEIDLILKRTSMVERKISDGESFIQAFTSRYFEAPEFWMIKDCMTILRELVLKGADINEINKHGETIAFTWFRHHPKLEMLQLLRDCRTDFRVHGRDGDSFLHIISRQGVEDGMIDFVMKECSDPNIVNKNGDAPVHVAIISKKYSVVEDLIEHGASLNIRNGLGKSPLHLVANSPKMVKWLVENGADVNVRDNEGKTLLHYVKTKELIVTLANAGAFVDAPDKKSHTPLFYAISRLDLVAIVELLKYGADIKDLQAFKDAPHYLQIFNSNVGLALQYMMEHLVQLSVAGLVKKVPCIYEESKDHLQEFVKRCEAEVEWLKSYYVDDSTSLYKLLHKNKNRKCAFADNKELENLVLDKEISIKFPMYFVIIMGCYYEARIRKPVLEKAVCVLKNIIEVGLPELCIDQILMHLNNFDLSVLVQVGGNLRTYS